MPSCLGHLDLPCGAAFVLALDARGTSTPHEVNGGPLGPIGVRAGDLLFGVAAHGLRKPCAPGSKGEHRRSTDH